MSCYSTTVFLICYRPNSTEYIVCYFLIASHYLLDVHEFKKNLIATRKYGIILDIDETLSDSGLTLFEQMVERFGMPPEGLDVNGLKSRYHLPNYVPYWENMTVAQEWMKEKRECKIAHEGLPIISGALEGTRKLSKLIPIVGYITTRSVSVIDSAIKWLSCNGFPIAPVIAKPDEVPFAECINWKCNVLTELFPYVLGIVDDDEKFANYSGKQYPGTIFLVGVTAGSEEMNLWVSCPTWEDVVKEVTERKIDLATHYSLDVVGFKEKLIANNMFGLVLDIDETLSATNVAWFERLIELFGISTEDVYEDLDVHGLVSKYGLAQNVPHWQTEAAAVWMKKQRESKSAQEGIPLVPGALEGAQTLSKIIPVVGYLTIRPVSVAEPTIEWLKSNKFPAAPVIAKPDEIPFEDGNQWKGNVLNTLFPNVLGIVDDNKKVAFHAGKEYPGVMFLFGTGVAPEESNYAIPCPTWEDVIMEAKKRRSDLWRRITRNSIS